MSGERILIIHRRQRVRDRIRRYLKAAPGGLSVNRLSDDELALSRLQVLRPHVVVLGCRFDSDVDCWRLCRSIRRRHPRRELGILAVVSCLEDGYESRALLEGADLCLHAERLSRDVVQTNVAGLVQRVGRRRDRRLRLGALTLVSQGRWMRVRGRKVQLTPTQFSVLWRLAQAPERLHSARAVIGYGDSVPPEKAEQLAYIHIHRLRKRLGEDSGLIRSVRGIGYGLDLKWQAG